MIVTEPREKLWVVMNSHLGITWSDNFRAIGLVRDNALQAVIGYDGFIGRTCCMHSLILNPKAITREFVRTMFHYPFVQCNLQYLIALVDSSNERAMKLDKHVGFEEKMRIPNGALEGDLVMLIMQRDKCRWIKEVKHGQEQRTPSS